MGDKFVRDSLVVANDGDGVFSNREMRPREPSRAGLAVDCC